MSSFWRVELNPDVTVTTDGTHCEIGGVVSVAFVVDEVEFVWSESPEVSLDPPGLLRVLQRDPRQTLASIRLRRGEAQRVRALLESGGPRPH